MLGQLNKLDAQIESNLKKIERQAQELDSKPREFYVDTREEGKRNDLIIYFPSRKGWKLHLLLQMGRNQISQN